MDERRRAVFAAMVAAVGATLGVPGVGHAYLRQWRRAFGWFLAAVGGAVLLAFVFVDTATLASLEPGSISAADLPLSVIAPFYVLLSLSIVDAYVTARRVAIRRGGPDTGSCPHCGRDRDPSLSFCWYCSEPLGEPEVEEAEGRLVDVRDGSLLE